MEILTTLRNLIIALIICLILVLLYTNYDKIHNYINTKESKDFKIFCRKKFFLFNQKKIFYECDLSKKCFITYDKKISCVN